MQSGAIKHLDAKYNINFRITGIRCVELDGENNSVDAFGKEEVVSLFVLLGIGIFTATLLMLFESLLIKVRKVKTPLTNVVNVLPASLENDENNVKI